jgi:acid phosphatase family membrane protein YuiD
MEYIIDFLTNPYLLTGLGGWFWAQILKTIIHAIINKKIVWERLVGDGGMPSGHSATVTSLALFVAMRHGANSFEFAVCGILAIIVCHDAMGVRLETGKQAMVLNELVKAFEKLTTDDHLPEEKLKEFVGHTPIQVLAGIAVGILNAILMYWFLP